MTTFIGLFFGALLIAAIFGMVKIQRQELRDARAAKEKARARMDAFRAKCYRPDGD